MMLALAAAAVALGGAPLPTCGTFGHQGKLLYADDFSHALEQWRPEYSASPRSSIGVDKGKLVIDVDSGATVWFGHKLSGNVLITFKRKVVVEGGRNDRLSDFNLFWMASDPSGTLAFDRSGKFAEYDGLRLYYVGIGGNTNTTTRFRKYDGTAVRPLLGEANDAAHLLRANHEYAVQVAVYGDCTRVTVDGAPYFTWRDPAPLREGWFGFRTTWSRQEIDDFKIYQLE